MVVPTLLRQILDGLILPAVMIQILDGQILKIFSFLENIGI